MEPLAHRLTALLRLLSHDAHSVTCVILNPETACTILGCSHAELDQAVRELKSQGAVLHTEVIDGDGDTFYQRN